MKKLVSITSFISVNIILILLILELFNPLGLDLTGITYLNISSYFSSDPVINILMILSFLGLITFNLNLLLNRKK
jgi:hypothetical protein